MNSNSLTTNIIKPAPPGFGQPLAPGTPLPKGLTNKHVRFADQTQATQATPATGVSIQPGGKRRSIRKNKTTKRRRISRKYKSRRVR